jgi:hypothetical protein
MPLLDRLFMLCNLAGFLSFKMRCLGSGVMIDPLRELRWGFGRKIFMMQLGDPEKTGFDRRNTSDTWKMLDFLT